MGYFVETFANIGSNELVGCKGFDMPDGNDIEFPSMYNQGIDMSQNNTCASRSGNAFDDRTGSSRSN
ncbi:RING-H2 finger protein ATL66 [Cucumis melo var. makuwa]|uniref:RING-H2 finger protein ATL66 n=1 Tax=Cucumis melo var. makuwa TaxID=1194695 RepID=A0A5A7UXK3_CUCMM|nr:RING-H2 finger protein ATL66 [Cucumis melo var. makuwa]TYK02279.1 RING-H2 finger protein ATL66 [Cucumis melo var. makuwa]